MLKMFRYCLVGIIFCSLNGCAAWLAPKVNTELLQLRSGEYSLDKTHARLLFKVQHLGLSTYVGRFNEFDASLNFDPNKVEETKLDAVIQIDSLDINDSKLRDTLMGNEWFNQSRYPQAHFTTVSVIQVGGGVFKFTGHLTWHGVTKPIVLDVIFHGGADNWLTQKYTLGFSAKTRFKRSDFGMDSYIPIVGDEVDLEVYAEFQRARSAK